MRNWKGTIWIAFILSILGIGLMIFFAFDKGFNDRSGVLDSSLASEYGSLIGGVVGSIFTLAGMLLLYETIVAQRKSFEIQQFEARLFELIRMHRDNVAQMTHRIPNEADKYSNGASVFVQIKSQFSELYRIIKPKVDKDKTIADDDKEREAINISYFILFFGVSREAREDLENALSGFDKKMIREIIEKISARKTEYDSNTVYFGGHQVRLGHYYRHLYLTVKYVDKTKFLNEDEKYDYVKILRAQLTNHEQALFFINSLSIGKKWEDKKNKFITKYKLIRNLPRNFIKDIDPKKYYNFVFEWDNDGAK